MSGPGDRAPKWPLMWEADAVNGAAGYSTPPKNGRGAGCIHRGPRARQAQKPFARKLGDLEGALPPLKDGEQSGEGSEPQSLAKAFEKSDAVVVPGKSAKTWVTPVESMEGRTKAKGMLAGRNAPPTQGGTSAPTDLQRVGHSGARLNRGGSPVREIRSPGSVRGAARKGRPYRDE